MRERNSTDNRERPIILPRKSPRFLQQNQSESECPKTPKPIPKQNRVRHSDLKPRSSIPDEVSLNKSQKLKRGQLSDEAKETKVRCRSFIRVRTGPRRSTRLSREGDDFLCVRQSRRFSQNGNVEKTSSAKEFGCVRRSPRFSQNGNLERIGSDICRKEGSSEGSSRSRRVDLSRKPKNVIEKRLTRSSIRTCNNGGLSGKRDGCNGFSKSIPNEDSRAQCTSDKRKVKGNINLSEQCMYQNERRVTRSASQGVKDEKKAKIGDVRDSKATQHVLNGCSSEKILSDDGKAKLAANFPKEPINESEDRTTSLPSADLIEGRDWRGNVQAEKKQVGGKRKKIQAEEDHGILRGWTMEQELALERAYFAAKPTPHFWKKVAKMVPGRTAQECFDKIHSELSTPLQPHKRSRAKGMKASLSLSANKLLNVSEPETKKLRQRKQKSHLTHKAVRHLLQKQYNLDQDNEADLFAVLEPTLYPHTEFVQDGRLFSTPDCNREKPGIDKRCLDRSYSAHKKHLSQSNDSCGATLISPPVLKKIKNKALHEKYIDQLHSREAKRKAAALRANKCIKGKSDIKENKVQKSEAVKDAKNALVFSARDAIHQFHHLQSSTVNNFDNTSHDFTDSSDDEIEDGS